MKFIYYFLTWFPVVFSEYVIGKFYGKILISQLRNKPKDLKILGWVYITGAQEINIGDGVTIREGAYIRAEGGLEIGDHTAISANCSIYTHVHNTEGDMVPCDFTIIKKPVKIGNNVLIGRNVNIQPGSNIGNGVIIGMGAVISGDIPDCAIVVGNPARVMGYRDKERYSINQEKNQFFRSLTLKDSIKNYLNNSKKNYVK